MEKVGAGGLRLDGDHHGPQSMENLPAISEVGADIENKVIRGDELRVELQPPLVFVRPLPKRPFQLP
jgi:hypothetical protein